MSKRNVVISILLNVLVSGASALVVAYFVIGNLSAAPETIETSTETKFEASSMQEDVIVKAVEASTPAVVSIVITKDVPIMEQYFADPFGGNNPFGFKIPQYRENGTENKKVGGGSGFIVSADGYIVTNNHVVSDPEAEYTVFMSDGTKYEAKVIDKDVLNDLAIVKIEAEDDLPYLQFADSDMLKPGQSAIAIGTPLLEFDNSVSVGVVSGLSRSITAGNGRGMSEQLEGVIQTDAAINPGNSGGPLLNLKGEVIGVNVAVASAQNIGFSVPANIAKSVFDSVKEHGKIIRPYMGVRFTPVTPELVEKNSLPVDYGVLISRGETISDLAIMPGSPADKAGLLENDIILEVDGVKLDGETSLAVLVSRKKVGDKVVLKVMSKGDEKEVMVTLEEAPEAKK